METRYAVIDKKTGARIYKISQVDNPAIEANYISMSKDPKPVYLNAEKTCLIGPVLIPEIDILRYDEEKKEYYNFRFSEEVIKESMKDFVSDHLIGESNIQHNEKYKIDGKYIENWIIRDSEKDTANALGLKQKNGDLLPVGTWMTVFYPTDPTVLTDEFLQSFRGFSIEGSFYQDTVMKKENDLNLNMSLYNELLKKFEDLSNLVLGKKQVDQKFKIYKITETEQQIQVDDISGKAYFLNADGTYKNEWPIWRGVFSVEGGVLVIESEAAMLIEGTTKDVAQSIIKIFQKAITVKETMQIINMNDETGVCNWLNADGTIGDIVTDGVYILDDDSTLTVTNSIGVITTVENTDSTIAETETVIAEMKKILVDQEAKHKLELTTLALEFEKLKNGIQEFNHTKKQEPQVQKEQSKLERILELKEKRS